jgi:hypothetical protein
VIQLHAFLITDLDAGGHQLHDTAALPPPPPQENSRYNGSFSKPKLVANTACVI